MRRVQGKHTLAYKNVLYMYLLVIKLLLNFFEDLIKTENTNINMCK